MQIFFQYIYIEKFSGDLKQHEKLAHELLYRNIFENKEKGMSWMHKIYVDIHIQNMLIGHLCYHEDY